MFKKLVQFVRRWRCSTVGHVCPVCVARKIGPITDKAVYVCHYCEDSYEIELPTSRRTISSRHDSQHH